MTESGRDRRFAFKSVNLHSNPLRSAAAAVVVLAVAALAYGQFIPVSHLQRGRLALLVTQQPPAPFPTKPTSSVEVAASDSPFAGVKAAAKKSPSSTGSYSTEWTSTTSTNDVDAILMSLLPSAGDATAVQAAAKTAYVSPKSLTSDSYTLHNRFTVASIPGADSAVFTSSVAKSNSNLAVVVFRLQRVVVVDFSQYTGSVSQAQAAAVSLSQIEYQHLRQVTSGFSLVRTTRPLVASVVYAAGAVVSAVAVAVLLWLITRRHRRQVAKEAARREAIRRGQQAYQRHRQAQRGS